MSEPAQAPLLSVCIPAYNRGKWLADRIREWLAAAPEDVEVVVSDNASSDDTADAVADIGDPRLVLVRNGANVGAFENQLRAFEAAHGRYVMQLMDKDELVPDGIAVALSALARTDAVCGEFVINSSGASAKPVRISRGFDAFRRYNQVSILISEHGAIDLPFVRMNLPPYDGVAASVSYRDPAKYYFTPSFLVREFAEYAQFLERETRLSALVRMRLVARLAGGPLFNQMTVWYRWRLESDAMCAWYGMRPEFRESELRRDLVKDGADALRGIAGVGRLTRLAVRLGVAKRLRRKDAYEIPENIRGGAR